jgi:hypothetical protein
MHYLHAVYKFIGPVAMIEPNYILVEDNLTLKQAILYVNKQDKPSDYFIQPYRKEATNEEG